MSKQEKKKVVIILVITVLLLVGVPWFLNNGDSFLDNGPPKDRVEAILADGLDTTKSTFLDEENRKFEEQIAGEFEKIKILASISGNEVLEIARIYRDVNDYQAAIELYEIVQELGTDDFLVAVDIGDIYLEMGQPTKAAEAYQLGLIKFPSIYELHIGLAKAYKQIPDTPQYVVDDVYRNAILGNVGQYELYEALIDWLEKTDREKDTLQYYEIINKINPQPLLQQRIDNIKNKYQL